MKPEWWPGEEHEAFTKWAFDNGVQTDAVTPARLQGRGLGMVATRNIKVRDRASFLKCILIISPERRCCPPSSNNNHGNGG